MVRAIVEIHFVADFCANAEYAGEGLDAARRVKDAIEVSVRQDRGEIAESHRARCNSEADESTLQRSIDAPGTSFADGKLRTDEKMSGSEVSTNWIGQPANRDMGGSIEVVSAFDLKDNMRVHVDGDTPAYAQHIEVVGVVKPEIIDKDAHLAVILCKRGRRAEHDQGKKKKLFRDASNRESSNCNFIACHAVLPCL